MLHTHGELHSEQWVVVSHFRAASLVPVPQVANSTFIDNVMGALSLESVGTIEVTGSSFVRNTNPIDDQYAVFYDINLDLTATQAGLDLGGAAVLVKAAKPDLPVNSYAMKLEPKFTNCRQAHTGALNSGGFCHSTPALRLCCAWQVHQQHGLV